MRTWFFKAFVAFAFAVALGESLLRLQGTHFPAEVKVERHAATELVKQRLVVTAVVVQQARLCIVGPPMTIDGPGTAGFLHQFRIVFRTQ